MTTACDDSDDDFMPLFLRPGQTLSIEEDNNEATDQMQACNSTDEVRSLYLRTLNDHFMTKDVLSLEVLGKEIFDTDNYSISDMESIRELYSLVSGSLCHGPLAVLQSPPKGASLSGCLTLPSMFDIILREGNPVLSLHDEIIVSIAHGKDLFARQIRYFYFTIVGVALLELYLQVNYTGPELSDAALAVVSSSNEKLRSLSTQYLECDGDYAFPLCQIPQTLLLSRAILSVLGDPGRAPWICGIVLAADGLVSKAPSRHRNLANIEIITATGLSLGELSRLLYSARAVVIHARCLQQGTHSNIPTLWKECQDLFAAAMASFDTTSSTEMPSDRRAHLKALHAQVVLEWGLCCHYLDFGDKGKSAFHRAKEIAGLTTELTAALGKRTKYQHTDYAQLYLRAESTLAHTTVVDDNRRQSANTSGSSITLKDRPQHTDDPAEENDPNPDGWKHAEWELGRRLVGEIEGTGEEAAVREVMLDSMDGGPDENILLEGGPKFSSAVDKGDEMLHPVDQAIILALCLDVSNSNPQDGLTHEEMYPYVERVLQLAQNWMIHSTALLERSWLEYERRKTCDRAMLQIQALLDQHTTKLTITQSTFKAIEESAPAPDRLRYISSIVYPAQYELKRDLAFRYMRGQVFVSALNLFKELELWDEIVTCYQLLDKPQRAEMVVRDRLKHSETPYMLTSLADLTKNEELYERAWLLSKGRYARAKRTLARVCFDRGDFRDSIRHLDAALGIQPLVATAWYLRGIACMHVEDWSEGITSFVRCVQQDEEIGEAYANIGAIHMRLKDHSKAYPALLEALKHKSDSWKIMENLLAVCLALGRWKDMVLYMNKLLDLKGKSQRPVHKKELRYLALLAAEQARQAQQPQQEEAGKDSSAATADGSNLIEVTKLTPLAKSVEDLIIKITNSIKSDAEVWDILAEFYDQLGRSQSIVDCRMKQMRALTAAGTNWEKEPSSIDAVVKAAEALSVSHAKFAGVSKADLYAGRSLLQTVLNKIQQVYEGHESSATWVIILEGLIRQCGELYSAR